MFTVVANKTFFKCDKANMLWNCKGDVIYFFTYSSFRLKLRRLNIVHIEFWKFEEIMTA